MHSDDRVRKRATFRRPMILLGVVMTVFYIVLGLLLLLQENFLPTLPTDLRNIFAVLVLVYGSYRGWRVYADYF